MLKDFLQKKGKQKLTVAMNNLLSMIACFKKEQVQEDLRTVCKLIKYTLEKGRC